LGQWFDPNLEVKFLTDLGLDISLIAKESCE